MFAPAEALAWLESSSVFVEGVPRRRRIDRRRWALISSQERHETVAVRIVALRAVRDHQVIADVVCSLGVSGYTPAVPVLAQLWEDCAVRPVRAAAGHALRALGTREALAVLAASIDDADPLSTSLAVRAIFDDDPKRAFDRLARHFDDDDVTVALEILGALGPHAFTADGPAWRDAGPLRHDARWIALCLRMRRDARLGAAARYVLRHAARWRRRRQFTGATTGAVVVTPAPENLSADTA